MSIRSDVPVGGSVVIVVAHGDADPIHLDIEPCPVGDVRKSIVPVVAIKPHCCPPAMVARPVHSVYQQDVQPTVVVKIEESATWTECFRQVFLAELAAVVLEGNACLAGHVRKLD